LGRALEEKGCKSQMGRGGGRVVDQPRGGQTKIAHMLCWVTECGWINARLAGRFADGCKSKYQ